MNDQENTTTAREGDVEGHHFARGIDGADIDDVEGHSKRFGNLDAHESADDVEGHRRMSVDGDEDDVEGHKFKGI